MKRTLAVCIVVGFVILIIGYMFNMQEGLYLNDDFWRRRSDSRYTHGKSSITISKTNEGRHYDIQLNGCSIPVDVNDDFGLINNKIETISDGWSLEQTSNIQFSTESAIIESSTEYSLILTDLDKIGCRFEKADPIITESILNKKGDIIGERFILKSQSGTVIDTWENYTDGSGSSSAPRGKTLIENGSILSANNQFSVDSENTNALTYNVVYINAQGEYLTNPDVLFCVDIDGNIVRKDVFARFLFLLGEDADYPRGSLSRVIFFITTYIAYMAAIIWPKSSEFVDFFTALQEDGGCSRKGVIASNIICMTLILLSIAVMFSAAWR